MERVVKKLISLFGVLLCLASIANLSLLHLDKKIKDVWVLHDHLLDGLHEDVPESIEPLEKLHAAASNEDNFGQLLSAKIPDIRACQYSNGRVLMWSRFKLFEVGLVLLAQDVTEYLHAGSVSNVLDIFKPQITVDVVLADIILSDGYSFVVLDHFRKHVEHLTVIYMTGYGPNDFETYVKAHPGPVLEKPISLKALSKTVQSVCKHTKLELA